MGSLRPRQKLGLPDTGYYTGLRQFTHNIPGSLRPGAAFRYISYGEMIDAGRDICAAVSIPVLGDGCPQKPACAHSRNSARCSVEAMGSADSCLCGLTALWQATRAIGNAMNVKRTVRGYAQAGFAAVMIEDQAAPPQPPRRMEALPRACDSGC